MKIVGIKEMSDGNSSVGEMWKETKIFDGSMTLEEAIRWLGSSPKNKNLILSVPADEVVEFKS